MPVFFEENCIRFKKRTINFIYTFIIVAVHFEVQLLKLMFAARRKTKQKSSFR